MKRWTTPTIPLRVDGVDLKSCSTIWVTLKQGDVVLEKETSDIIVHEVNLMSVKLTQEETAMFAEGDVYIDARMFINDEAIATKKRRINVEDVLREGVIS